MSVSVSRMATFVKKFKGRDQVYVCGPWYWQQLYEFCFTIFNALVKLVGPLIHPQNSCLNTSMSQIRANSRHL